MSSTVMVEGTDISITKFASHNGPAYQITWRSSDKEHLFDYVSFEQWADAEAFVAILRKRLVR